MNEHMERVAKEPDRELLRLYLGNPGSPQARAAREELEYRKYRTQQRHNLYLILVTIVIAVCSVVTVGVQVIDSANSQKAPSRFNCGTLRLGVEDRTFSRNNCQCRSSELSLEGRLFKCEESGKIESDCRE